jgi:DNA invertase Pin-like site-specific DNA recombinase
MLRIGYVRVEDRGLGADAAGQAAALEALGCHVVRAEDRTISRGEDFKVLNSILDFLATGDQLVVGRLEQLGPSSRGILQVLERLEARGASLQILEPELCSTGLGGKALHAVLEAMATVEPTSLRQRRPAANQEIGALRRAGVGPVEIARRLGVSRMTVWRKLKAMQAC